MIRPRVLAVCAVSCVALVGCTVGPDYRRPTLATPAAYEQAAATPRTAVNAQDADLSRWWTQFSDPVLESLVRRALAGNLDLEAAASRVREARLKEVIAGAAGLPTLGATASPLTLNSNAPSPPAGAGATSPIPRHLNLYSAGFDATWEIDLFGGVRRSVQEAKANTEASEWSRRDGEVTLVAEVANDYLALRAAQARIAVGEAELARQRSLFALISDRRATGFVTNLDVNQQTAVVATAAAQIPQLQAQATSDIDALGVLLGQTPESLTAELSPPGALPAPPPTLPTGLPSELLRRRPDIREAERKLAASNAEIGVQTANLYPKLELIGFAGFGSMTVGDLFSAEHLTSAAIGMLSQPIFEGGKTHASIAVAKEEHAQALLSYETTVLRALRDVEDNLARFRASEQRRQSLAQAVDAARASITIATDQYRAGTVSFINVLQAETTVLNAEDQLTQADAESATDLVSLYKALGGGWST